MTIGTNYDYQQFVKDCRNIIRCYGKYVQQGFFTVSKYADEQVSIIMTIDDNIQIIDRAGSPSIQLNNEKDMDDLPNYYKSIILNLAVRVDELETN